LIKNVREFRESASKTQHLIVLLDCHAERLHGKRQQSNGGQGCPPNISVLQKFFDLATTKRLAWERCLACLRGVNRPGCWQIRTCLKRYLPGISSD